jgi:hypothetical protein
VENRIPTMIYLPDDENYVHDGIKDDAKRRGITINDWILEAIQDRLGRVVKPDPRVVRSPLTYEQVMQVKKLMADGATLISIAELFSISIGLAASIRYGKGAYSLNGLKRMRKLEELHAPVPAETAVETTEEGKSG